MKSILRFFHYLSFLQFPLLLVSIWYFIHPIFAEQPNPIGDVGTAILYIGIALSFGSLSEVDPKGKVVLAMQAKPLMLKLWLAMLCLLIAMIFIVAILGLRGGASNVRELSLSLLVLGIGMLGLLRMSIDAFRVKDNAT